MQRRHFLHLGSAAAVGLLAGCGSGGDSPTPTPTPTPNPTPPPPAALTVLAWNNATLDAIRTARISSPLAARALAFVHSAMYEAWAIYHPSALDQCSCGGSRRPPAEHTLENRRQAMSHAAHAALLDQFAPQRASFDAVMAALGYSPGAAHPGAQAAAKVIERFHHDGANQLGNLTPGGLPFADYTGYVAQNAPLIVSEPTPRSAIAAPGRWAPLSYRQSDGTLRTPAYQLPFWGRVKPYALSSGAQFRPPAPAAFGTPAFIEQAEHIVRVQQNLTEAQKVRVDYWAGGASGETAPTLWCLTAQHIVARDGYGDDQAQTLFYALGNAAFDASIAAWDAKRAYDNARPISAIRYLLAGQSIVGYGPGGPAAGTMLIQGEAWIPYQLPGTATPPFADHVSGHSTVSAACATILKLHSGSDSNGQSVSIHPASLLVEPALPVQALTLAWPTFSAAAAEAAQSRIDAGIHFVRANEDGLRLGEQVGATVFAKAERLWRGKA